MGTLIFRGDAIALAQQQYYTFAGTWVAGETVTFTINSKDYVYTLVSGDTVIATLVADLVAGFNALDTNVYPEFTGSTGPVASQGTVTSRLYFTANTAGMPFTIALATNSALGTISAPTVVQASKGPNHWDDGDNWQTVGGSTGTAPVNADDVYLQNNSVDILYGLDQSAVTLTSFNVAMTYTGKVGLPKFNTSGYWEYRSDYLTIKATTMNMGTGDGSGSGRFKWNGSTAQTTINCFGTGTSVETGLPSFLFIGTHASNTLNLLRGNVGVAFFAGETATIATIRIGYENNLASDAVLLLGSGCTLTTISQSGGTVTYQSNITTHTLNPGTATIMGTATVGTLTIEDGEMIHNSTGTVTTLTVGSNGIIDFSNDLRTRTITNTTIYADATLLDPNKVVTFTNPILISHASLADLKKLDLGVNFSIQRS